MSFSTQFAQAPGRLVVRSDLRRTVMFTLSIAVYSALLFASAVIRGSSIDASLDCSVLQTLNFRQHEAPEDISSVVSRITASANKELEGVEYIMMTWEGDFVHHAVGSYNIRTNVKIVGENGHRCYITLIRVEDTNECDERVPNEWQHACHESSVCVNTNGDYMCVCGDSSFVLFCVLECCPKNH